MKPKTKLYRGYALDGPLYTDVADGKVDFGLVPISEAKAAPSVEYAGPIPAEVQLYVLFSSGISTSSKQAELGEALVQFITLPAAQAFFQSKGFDPP
jgi:molybdate transport system substrate-binding protein